MNIDANAVILAVIAAVPGTIVAIGSYRTSVKNRRQIVEQGAAVRDVVKTVNSTANKFDTLKGETTHFMKTVAIKTAEFEAAQLAQKKRASGFSELDP